MRNIVFISGGAIGSTVSMVRAIKSRVPCHSIVLTPDQKAAQKFKVSKFIDETELLKIKSREDILEGLKTWRTLQNFQQKPILYVTSDYMAFQINENRSWFERYFILCLPSSKIIKTYSQKGLAEKDAQRNGLIVPRSKVVETHEDIEEVIRHFPFPIIIKPRATYLKKGINFKFKVIQTKAAFSSLSTELIEKGRKFLCQEFIPGKEENSYYYLFYRTKHGHIYESMGVRSLTMTKLGGLMAKGVSKYESELSKLCKNFLTNIDYRGIGGIEFKKFNQTYYFIEMSVRIEAIHKAAEIAHVPLSLLSYYDLADQKTAIKSLNYSRQKDGITYINLINILSRRYRDGKYLVFLKDLWEILFCKNVNLDVYSKDDPNPFWLMLKHKLL